MIFTVTLNPAIDKILFLEEFQPSRTNRLTRTLETLGGKGTHVFVDLRLQGIACTALGIALGQTGKAIIRMLEEGGGAVDFLHYDLPGLESRTNYELVQSRGHVCTMLAERGPQLPRGLTDELLEQVQRLIGPGDMLVLSGDAGNVDDTSLYGRMISAANERGGRVFVDASGATLQGAVQAGPFLIKPNLEELMQLTGRTLNIQADILAAMRALDAYRLPMIAMTWGRQGAIVKDGQDYYRVNPPETAVVNEGGCGDAFLSGILAGIERGCNMIETLRTAAAVAASAAECELTVGFDPRRADALKEHTTVALLAA
ncbi:MAG TPA: PfkB family carbohydrate kinase [Anaerolineales bacterium]|nr:PfkB family carbohydrate kinase [Anaerolineales bacterium]